MCSCVNLPCLPYTAAISLTIWVWIFHTANKSGSSVSKPKGICRGISQVVVNGTRIKGNLIEPHPVGAEVVVEVTMG